MTSHVRPRRWKRVRDHRPAASGSSRFYRVRVIETETAPVSGTDGPLLMRNTSGEHTRPRVFPSAPRRRGSAAAD